MIAVSYTYQERLPVLCTGDLIKENNAFTLKNPRNLTLDELWQNDGYG
ncbi:hypothetical protein [Phormidium nigroviride]